jgi:iron complex outermembrane receptor protein
MKLKSMMLSAACLAAAAASAIPLGAAAQTVRHRIDLAAAPLDQALTALSRSLDEPVIFSKALVSSFSSPRMSGMYTTEEALAVLLKGSGLTYARTSAGVIMIERAPKPVAPIKVAYAAPAGAAAPQTAPAAPMASSQIEEVVVTAQKREQRLQDVPISVTALSSADLVANRVDNVQDLNGLAPNLTTRPSAGGAYIANYTIRGLFAQGSAPGADKGVSQYIDGVYLQNAGASIFDLAEIQRIEVLKGPQGTLFGRNATGGAISIFTRNPPGKFGFKQEFTVGNYDQFRSRTRIDTPTWGPFSATLTFTHIQRRGDIKNLGAGTVWDYSHATFGAIGKLTSPQTLGDQDINAVFTAVRFAPTDKVEALYKFDYSHNDFTPDANGVAATRFPPVLSFLGSSNTPITTTRPSAVNNWFSAPGHTTNYGHNLTMTYAVDPHLKLKNIFAVRYSSLFVANELAGFGGVLVAPNVPFLSLDSATETHEHQWSDEFQVNYDVNWLTLTAGYLHFEDKVSIGAPPGPPNTIIFSIVPGFVIPFAKPVPSIPSSVHLVSDAGYGQAEFHVTTQIDLVGGVRWTRDKKNGVDNGFPGSPIPIIYDKSKMSYLVGANYKPTDDILAYIKYSTGYVSGGFLANNAYKPETAASLEGGVKSEWFEHRLRANLAVFSVHYANLQQVTSGATYCLIQPAVPCTSPQVTFNFGDAHAKGFELEMTAKPLEGVTLDGGVGYTNFKVTNLAPFLGTTTPGLATTWYPPYRPDWTVNLAAQYDTHELVAGAHGSLRVDADFRSQSHLCSCGAELGHVSDPAGIIAATTIPGSWLVNARAALVNIDLGHGVVGTAALWGRNIFDNKEEVFAGFGVVFVGANYERARTFGADFSIEF